MSTPFPRNHFPATAFPMTLISLASRQIWPQVLAALHLRPSHLALLHSDDADESRLPAQRLMKFFDKQGVVPAGGVALDAIPDADFGAIEKRLDSLAAAHSWNLSDCVLNITGGNKLMATAAFRWAARRSVRTFYLERRNRATWFDFRDGEIVTKIDQVDGHLADGIDPVALLRCQVDASEVEREGERLTLSEAGEAMPEEEFCKRIGNGNDPSPFLSFEGEADKDRKKGDALELATAAILLKLGVASVRRSLRLKVKSARGIGTRLPHAEIDLLFSWDGRLWLVDCKDRKPADSLIEGLRRELPRSLGDPAEQLLRRIGNELSIGQTKVLKEDLLAIRETGGLLGQVVCVRKSELPEEVVQFANHNRIELVQKAELTGRWRALLFPNRVPKRSDLEGLAKAFGG